MEIKIYSTLPKVPGLEPRHQTQFSIIPRKLFLWGKVIKLLQRIQSIFSASPKELHKSFISSIHDHLMSVVVLPFRHKKSRPGSDDNEGVLQIPQSSSITGTSPSDCSVSYPGHFLEGVCCWCILQFQQTRQYAHTHTHTQIYIYIYCKKMIITSSVNFINIFVLKTMILYLSMKCLPVYNDESAVII